MDRTKAQQIGFTQRDVAQNLLVSLSGSFQTSPTFWLDPKNGVSYSIATQTPQYRARHFAGPRIFRSRPAARRFAIDSWRSLAQSSGSRHGAWFRTTTLQPVIDIFGSVSGRDLGGVAGTSTRSSTRARTRLPRGSHVVVRGQVQTMRVLLHRPARRVWSFAILLVYLLIVVNFQSWLDPFIMISALPAALAGIAWFLFVTSHDVECACADGIDHVHGRRHREQHPGGQFRHGADGRKAKTRSRQHWRRASRAFGRC